MGDEWRTGEECVGIYPAAGDNPGKLGLIPHNLFGAKRASTCKLALSDEPMSD